LGEYIPNDYKADHTIILITYTYLDPAEIEPVLEGERARSCRPMLYSAGVVKWRRILYGYSTQVEL
jgi:hypothetical protein